MCTVAAVFVLCAAISAGPRDTSTGDKMLAAYFAQEVEKLRTAGLADVQTSEAWKARREDYRARLRYMLGLEPLPPRTPLDAAVTGKLKGDGFTVEKLYFQSSPGLYVTCNLYLPAETAVKAPTILYLCGHSRMFDGQVSLGNKTGYQHYGPWFARHGYVCLTVDTLQLGEVQGVHDGAHRKGRFWWYSRGYTPAGVEVWNAMRALDYLESRPEVDGSRIGVTGRSGGGGYSWYLTALDDRVKASVPIAGMTDLAGQFADGTIGRHCDCMFQNNTYQWDFPTVAAMTAPRPLMIGATDRDVSYPLDGVTRLFFEVRRIYELYGRHEDLSLAVGPGIHEDTQGIQLACLRWFEKHLKGNASAVIDSHAEKLFEPRELKVFDRLPNDSINDRLDESFVPLAPRPPAAQSTEQWSREIEEWRKTLLDRSFRGWPKKPEPLQVQSRTLRQIGKSQVRTVDFVSQGPIQLSFEIVSPAGVSSTGVILAILDDNQWQALQQLHAVDGKRASLENFLAEQRVTVAFFAPRGVGSTFWNQQPPQVDAQIRRRFMLLGQTLDGMRIWDVRRALAAIRALPALADIPLSLQARGPNATIALYAALFEPPVQELRLKSLPATHRDGPALLNVARHLEMPQILALAADRAAVHLMDAKADDWQYAVTTARQLRWPADRLSFQPSPGYLSLLDD